MELNFHMLITSTYQITYHIYKFSKFVCDGSFGGGGRERLVKQWAISLPGEAAGDFFSYLSVEVLKSRSRLFVCQGPETQISNCKSKITAQKLAWLLFSRFS
jgi:hypothetical protein